MRQVVQQSKGEKVKRELLATSSFEETRVSVIEDETLTAIRRRDILRATRGDRSALKAALLAGCESYYGYPITPASEIAHAAAKYFPLVMGAMTAIKRVGFVAVIGVCVVSVGVGMCWPTPYR